MRHGEELFSTTDFWMAASLLAADLRIIKLEWSGTRATFYIEDKSKCEELKKSFEDGSFKVDAKYFSNAERTLKDMLKAYIEYQDDGYLETSDFWLASATIAAGIPLTDMQWDKDRAIFMFEGNHKFSDLVCNYWAYNLPVSAKALTDAEKFLKTTLHTGEFNGTRHNSFTH